MTAITDDTLALLHHRRADFPPGDYAAPCATAAWDGAVLHLHLSGQPLDDATAAAWPKFAALFTPVLMAGLAPTIAALEEDYTAATADLPGAAPESVFQARLATCRDCICWDESGRGGRGSCDYVFSPCSCRYLHLAAETCPASKWP